MPDLSKLYQFRFRERDRRKEKRIWKVLCERFFQPLVGDDLVVLDLACGHGGFINNIRGKKKYAVDLNPDARANLAEDVTFFLAAADKMPAIGDGAVDVVFASNFLEHLRTKEECDRVFAEVRRILRPGGRFIVMGPNIRYLAGRYWDFYDHCLPLSHLSLEEGLAQSDYEVELIVPRFLPYTTRSRLPQHPFLVALYLRVPPAWRLLGRQFLVIARKPAAAVTAPT